MSAPRVVRRGDRQPSVVAEVFGGRYEVSHQLLGDAVSDVGFSAHLLDSSGHVQQPTISFEWPDVERKVPHPQLRMAPLLHIRGRTTPVLSQEEVKSVPGTAQVWLLGIERQEDLVGGHSFVEGVDEFLEECKSLSVVTTDSGK